MMNLIAICKDAKNIGISGHIRPDGDCVGSTCALRQFLKKAFPEKRIDIRLEQPADIYDFIPGVTEICTDAEDVIYDVFFVLDSIPERIGDAYDYYEKAKYKVNIDHHVTNPGCGDIYYIDAAASSASELVYDLIKEAEQISLKILKENIKGYYVDYNKVKYGIRDKLGKFFYNETECKPMIIVVMQEI